MTFHARGWLTVYCWEQTALHLGSRSIGRLDRDMRVRLYQDSYQFYRKHFGVLAWPLWLVLRAKILMAAIRFRLTRVTRAPA
jgi:hypothetical protein